MDSEVILIGIPLGAVALAGLALHYVGTEWVRKISNASYVAEVTVIATAWFLLAALPREENINGVVCPVTGGALDFTIGALAFVGLGIAAISLASSIVVVSRLRGEAWRILAGIGAGGLCFSIFVGILFSALCGMN